MRGRLCVRMCCSVYSFSGRSSSAPVHMRNSGTLARETLPQNSALFHGSDPTAPEKPPALIWISSTPTMAKALIVSTAPSR